MLQGIRLRDVAGGLAKSLDDRLKNSLDRNQAAADRIQDRQSIRAEREVQREEEENRQVSELLTEFANMVDESQVPAGMTKHDYAAGLFNKGGGTIAGATSFLADLREHQRGGGSVSGLIDYATLQTGGRNQGDYVNQFVRQADTMVRIPDALKGGTGLAGKLFDINLGEGIQEEIDASYGTRTPVEKIQMEQLGFKEGAELLATGDAKKQRELRDIQLQQARANLQTTLADNAMKGSIDTAQVNKDYKTVLTEGLRRAGISVDAAGGFDIDTAAQNFKEVQEVYRTSIKNITENAISTNALNVSGMKSTLKTLSIGALQYVDPTWSRPENMIKGQIYYTGSDTKNPEGAILFTGDLDNSILLQSYN
tara:strand:+ start:437 stop:1537 length:1101 start_codon:yes stop_codon:yes gene_type:complete